MRISEFDLYRIIQDSIQIYSSYEEQPIDLFLEIIYVGETTYLSNLQKQEMLY